MILNLRQASSAVAGFLMTGSVCLAQSSVNNLEMNNNPMDIGVSALFSAGAASEGNETIGALQGGGHDPSKVGFTLQNLELTLSGAVDPFFNAQTNIIMLLNDEGEAILEIEEAFMSTSQLPAGLQIKAGQFYTEFGRQNKIHPHTWAFVDQPIVLSRLLGAGGLRSQGGRLSWLTPTPWYSELFLAVQNAKGATGSSFLSGGHAHDEGAEESEFAINGPEDFIYSARWFNGTDINDSVSANIGFSGIWGPNANGMDSDKDLRTSIYGADLYIKWQASHSSRGYPFLSWHTEYLHRDYEEIEGAIFTRKDNGWFSQVSYGFKPGWIGGVRLESASSNEGAVELDTTERFRTALNLTWFPSEFSKIRLQYNYDDSKYFDEPVHLMWLQFEYNLGSHAAHTF